MPPEQSVAVWVPAEGQRSAETRRSIAATVSGDVEIVEADDVTAAIVASGRHDLVVALPAITVFDGWLARLVAAAHSDSTIASASALLTQGRWSPEPMAADASDAVAGTIAKDSARLYPRVGEPQAGCVLLRRTALDAVGPLLGAVPATTAGWLAEFAERCSAVGLGHVLADDVLAVGVAVPIPQAEAAALDARWPHRTASRAFEAEPESAVGHALLVASRGLDRLSVTIDGRALGPQRAGTQVHALELIAALGRTGAVALRVVTPPDLHPQARDVLDAIDGLTMLQYETAANDGAPPTDIVHRPSQVFTMHDLALLLPLGRRLVVTHQDLIAYRIPGYHADVEDWLRYRRTTQNVLSAADHVVFFSAHARADAVADNLVVPAATSVVPIGVDHHVTGAAASPRRPSALERDERPFLLCLGADLPHKNHGFAIALLRALHSAHGWDGRLVFAGPTGSPGAIEIDPQDSALVQLGLVDEDDKAWLLAHAAAVVYPTLYEGFGLIPFEAGLAGTPCVFAAQTALAEMLPAAAATLVPWDVGASAAAVAELLEPGAARQAHVQLLRESGSRYRWDDAAAALVGLYDAVLVAPLREPHRGPRGRLRLEQQLRENEHLRALEWQRQLEFREQIGSDGLGLVGPGGVLTSADQRALLALMSRSSLRRPLLAAARAAYGAARRLRRS